MLPHPVPAPAPRLQLLEQQSLFLVQLAVLTALPGFTHVTTAWQPVPAALRVKPVLHAKSHSPLVQTAVALAGGVGQEVQVSPPVPQLTAVVPALQIPVGPVASASQQPLQLAAPQVFLHWQLLKNCPSGQVVLTHSPPHAVSPAGHSHAQVAGLTVCVEMGQVVLLHTHVSPVASSGFLRSFLHSQLQLVVLKNWSGPQVGCVIHSAAGPLPHTTSPVGHSHAQVTGLTVCVEMGQVVRVHTHCPVGPVGALFASRHSHCPWLLSLFSGSGQLQPQLAVSTPPLSVQAAAAAFVGSHTHALESAGSSIWFWSRHWQLQVPSWSASKI